MIYLMSAFFFTAILYADDSTLITTLEMSDVNISYELPKISNWLKLNMLSINVLKSKFIVGLLHMLQKHLAIIYPKPNQFSKSGHIRN